MFYLASLEDTYMAVPSIHRLPQIFLYADLNHQTLWPSFNFWLFFPGQSIA